MASKLVLITPDERIPLALGAPDDPDHSTLYYRRIPSKDRRDIISRNTVMGVTDWWKCGYDFAHYAIVGWDNVPDASGKQLTFHKDLIAYLPDEALSEVIVKLNENAPASFFDNSTGHGSAATSLRALAV